MVHAPTSPDPLFTGDDFQLIAEAGYREQERRDLFERQHGVPAPEDDQLVRLADLAARIAIYLRDRGLAVFTI
jgi:hypothetical protein